MKPASSGAWPPLIVGANVSGWVRLRDFVLTVLAWALLAYLMRETLDLAHDYLRYPIFEFTNAEPPDWVELWGRLRPFWHFIALLTLWLLFWALVRGRRMRATAPEPQPAPLVLAAHGADFGLEESALARWREARVLVVHFDASGQVSHAETEDAPQAAPGRSKRAEIPLGGDAEGILGPSIHS